MVHAVHLDLVGALDLRQPAARLVLDLVGRLVARLRLAVLELGAGLGAHVLKEGPSQRHVEHLDAAAYGKDGQPPLERDVNGRGLENVARGRHLVERRMRRLAVARRVHVAAAREQQAAELAGEPLERGRAELGRQRNGHAAGLLYGVQIRGIDVCPLGVFAHRDGSADADERQAAHGAMLPYAA